MLILVSYDVPDDRRRTKLAHALKDFGERVQYSVFEFLLNESQVGKLRERIEGLVDAAEDSVRIYRFCADCGLSRASRCPGCGNRKVRTSLISQVGLRQACPHVKVHASCESERP